MPRWSEDSTCKVNVTRACFRATRTQAFGATGLSSESRWHFDYYPDAMLAIFNIFIGGWVDAFEACAEATGVALAVAYFVPALIVGFFVLMNLFIAILLEAFAEEEEEEAAGDEESDGPSTEQAVDGAGPADLLKRAGLASDEQVESPPLEGVSLGLLGPESCIRLGCQYVVCHPCFDALITVLIVVSSVCLALDVPRLDPASELKGHLDKLNLWMTGAFVLEMSLKVVVYGFAFAYLKDAWNVLDGSIVLISILSLLADAVPFFGRLKALRILRVLRPLRLLQRNPGMKIIITSLIKTLPYKRRRLKPLPVVFHPFFTPSIFHPQNAPRPTCYMHMSVRVRQGTACQCVIWPILMLGELSHVSRSVVDVCAVVLVFHVVFAIIGMMLFSGKFGACTDDTITTRADCVAASSAPALRARTGRDLKGGGGGDDGGDSDIDLPTEWLNPSFGSFDNFFSSVLILYVASTGDNWEAFMWAGMDVVDVDVAPVRNDHSPNSIYFIMWMIVGNFVALNLFVGAIVDNFTRIKVHTRPRP